MFDLGIFVVSVVNFFLNIFDGIDNVGWWFVLEVFIFLLFFIYFIILWDIYCVCILNKIIVNGFIL